MGQFFLQALKQNFKYSQQWNCEHTNGLLSLNLIELKPNDIESLLTNVYHLDIPEPGSKLQLSACTEIGVSKNQELKNS